MFDLLDRAKNITHSNIKNTSKGRTDRDSTPLSSAIIKDTSLPGAVFLKKTLTQTSQTFPLRPCIWGRSPVVAACARVPADFTAPDRGGEKQGVLLSKPS